MFKEEIWAMIHNRFKPDSHGPTAGSRPTGVWYDDMTAGDWWKTWDFGDPKMTTSHEMIADAPLEIAFQAFFERLHMAYGGKSDYFDNHAERSWYNEWILPFADPLNQFAVVEAASVWTNEPRDYFGDFRNYIQNESPSEMFQQHEARFDWTPNPVYEYGFHSAINKKVI